MSGGYELRSVSADDLQTYALATDRQAALATLALTEGVDNLYLKGRNLDQAAHCVGSAVRLHAYRAGPAS